MRPTDWFLVGLPVDPVPGDAFGVRALASKYAAIAEVADDASRAVHAARTSGAASAWVGDAGLVFRDRSHRMPAELAHAHESYAAVDAALRRWADTIDDAQSQADRALQQAREAHADRHAAAGTLASAELAWTTAHAQQLTYQLLEKSPLSVPPPVPLPTAAQLRSTDRAVQQARSTVDAAHHRIADADARIAAARALVLEAKRRRDEGERATVHTIAAAGDLAVQPSSIWEAIQDSAAWQTIVAVATVVLTIVSIVAIFVGGPLVWALILAGTVLLLVNALHSIAQGKDAWGELILLALGIVPGGRLLGLAVRGLSSVGRISAAVSHFAELTARLKSGAAEGLQSVVRRLADDTVELRLPSPRDPEAPTIHGGKQSKHIAGTPNFDSTRSTLTADPEGLIRQAGTGIQVGSVPRGEPGFKERIDFGYEIGIFADEDGSKLFTSMGIIHYASDGTAHIVPSRPRP